jgi:tRNA(Arg) A34 adenosine deaminase TadA
MSAQKQPTIPTVVSATDLNGHIRSHTSLDSAPITASSAAATSKSSSGTSTPKYADASNGVHIIDEGEKDKDGKVILASKEPCELCGGKVVWATMGEFFMVCQGCREPQ